MPTVDQTSAARPKKKILPYLFFATLLLALTSCCCCILWFRAGEMEGERTARVGSAERILAIRDQLDRIHDAFPAQPSPAACTETPPTHRVVALSLTQIATFRHGEGIAGADESSLDLVSTHIHGHDRPADGITDADAYAQLDTLVSPLRSVDEAPWLAVVRTRDVAMPAVMLDRFLSGRFEGDVVVFERASGRVLCAQPLSATNGAAVDVGTFEGGSDAARRDLATQLSAAKEQARQALSPRLQLDW